MTRSVVILQEEGWYIAKDPNSGVASQGKSIDEAISNLNEALELYGDGIISDDANVDDAMI